MLEMERKKKQIIEGILVTKTNYYFNKKLLIE